MTPYETLKKQIHFLAGSTHSIMPESVRSVTAPTLIDLLEAFSKTLNKHPLNNKDLKELYNTILTTDHQGVLQAAIDTLPSANTEDPKDKPHSGPTMNWTTPEPLAALLWTKFLPKTRFMGHISINASSSVSDFNPSVILSFLRADTLWSNPHRTDWNSLYNLRMSTTANLPKAILVELDEFLRKRAEATVLERQFMTLRRNGNNLQETLTFLALGITLLPRDEALSLIARTSLPIKSMSHHKLAKILQDAPDSDAFLGMRATVMGQECRIHYARKGHEWAISNKIRKLLKQERPVDKTRRGPWMANTDEAKAKRLQRAQKRAEKEAAKQNNSPEK